MSASGERGQEQDGFTAAQLARLAGGGVQRGIAHDVWPNGATLTCDECGASRPITTAECGYYLGHGWPKHCGRTMKLDSPALSEG